MRLLAFVTRRMVAKVFIAVALVVGAALLIQAARDTSREADRMRAQATGEAAKVAGLVTRAVEHAMLEGEGIEVKRLIAALQARTPDARIRVYDQRGLEVFAATPPPPPRADVPRPVAAALDGAGRTMTGDAIVRPLRSEARCKGCHPDDDALRGVLVLEVDRAACATSRDETVTRLVAAGFTHIMTARRSDLLDDYFAELRRAAPGIVGAAVLDRDGDTAYGETILELEGPAALAAAGAGQTTSADGARLVPLRMEPRCVACHQDADGVLRGALAVQLAPGEGGMCDGGELEAVIDTSLRFIMLSRLGRRMADFLDEAAATAPIETLELYDAEGRRYWTTDHPPPPAEVARALRDGERHAMLRGAGEDEHAVVVEPMANERRCTRCHGAGDPRRGAVVVELSTAMAAAMRAEVIRERIGFTVGLLVVLLGLLVGLLQVTVLRPVRQIGDVAERIGRGDLAARVARADPRGDEVARLGDRINAMVDGLRTKIQLERFVSRGTAAAAEAAGLRGVAREGERRAAAVLFSDLRGFTAFSETVEPERVVEMLNRVLEAQARVVHQHGGDIDKFVGDELMAVFEGEDASRRALACAVALPGAVGAALAAGERLAVGVGVAVGEVVWGAIGAEDRLDFTVIGDVVNTASRLCSAASAGQVLLTDAARAAAGQVPGITLSEVEPLAVKGKRAPLVVWSAGIAGRAARTTDPGD